MLTNMCPTGKSQPVTCHRWVQAKAQSSGLHAGCFTDAHLEPHTNIPTSFCAYTQVPVPVAAPLTCCCHCNTCCNTLLRCACHKTLATVYLALVTKHLLHTEYSVAATVSATAVTRVAVTVSTTAFTRVVHSNTKLANPADYERLLHQK